MNSLGWIFAFSECNLSFVLGFPYPFFSPPPGGGIIIHCCPLLLLFVCLFVVGELLFPPGTVGESVCVVALGNEALCVSVGFSSLWHPRPSPSSPEMCSIPRPRVAGTCWDETGLGPCSCTAHSGFLPTSFYPEASIAFQPLLVLPAAHAPIQK